MKFASFLTPFHYKSKEDRLVKVRAAGLESPARNRRRKIHKKKHMKIHQVPFFSTYSVNTEVELIFDRPVTNLVAFNGVVSPLSETNFK